MTDNSTEHLLGRGVLTWARVERITDRYGLVYLMAEGENSLSPGEPRSIVDTQLPFMLAGKVGTLKAKIIEARDSTHIGDIFRKIQPRKPEVGAVIILGHGTFTLDQAPGGGTQVGVHPEGRSKDWMDPRALYDVHEQTVDLIFVEEEWPTSG